MFNCGAAALNELKLPDVVDFNKQLANASPLYTIFEDSYEDALDFKLADLQRKTQKDIATIRVVGN